MRKFLGPMKELALNIRTFLLKASLALTSNRMLLLSVRLCIGLFVLMTAGYCLLAYIPFSYHWILNGSIASWVRGFGKIHPFLYWLVLLLATLTIMPELSRKKTRRLALGFILVHAVVGVWLLFRPLLIDLPNDESSLRWGMISLFPWLWIAAIDYVREDKNWRVEKNQGNLRLAVFMLWAAFLSALYIAVFFLRFSKDSATQFLRSELLFAITWSIASHFLLGILLFTLLKLFRSFANKFPKATKVEYILCNGLAILLLTLVLRYMIFSAISFNSTFASLFALTFSFSLMAFISGTNIRLGELQAEKYPSGLSLMLTPLLTITPKHHSSLLFRAAWLLVLIYLAYRIPEQIAMSDWAFLMQKLSVLAIWTISFGFFFAGASQTQDKKYSFLALFLFAALSFIGYRIAYLARYHVPVILNQERLDVKLALERYDAYEISFKVAHSILHPNITLFPTAKTDTLPVGAPAKVFDEAFYEFLRRSTNLDDSTPVKAVEVNLVNHLAPVKGKKPNIFIFVVDSLRQDYVSPYNQAATFTPSLAKFASESIVMQNSFTRYGGTALAEPSIWVGGMTLHKQYIQPFYPMNALQKMLDVDGYESIMTMDPVLKMIVKPSPTIVEVDKDKDWVDYDLCQTVKELQTKMDAREDKTKPLFVYTQSQNLHIVRRTRGLKVHPKPEENLEYPGFDTYWTTKLKAMDACFGEFIDYLKSRNLYDDSIIVFTSDHGDFLGEGGRWGHCFYIEPDLIRIPLIIHVPPKLLKGMVWNTEDVAFSADVTPSLYYLLGHRPIVNNRIFGRPLFTATQKEQTDYIREDYLIGSSYGAIYGILSKNGRTLYIGDSTNGRDLFYNIADDPGCEHDLITGSIKAKYRELILDYVSEINNFYNFEVLQ
jgi:hypothetical protein